MNIKEILSQLDFSKLDADYADVRVEKVSETKIMYRSGELREATTSPSLGAFIRVLKNGNWAFKSTTQIESTQDELLALSKRVSLLPAKAKLIWPKRESQKYESLRYLENNCNKATLQEKKEFCTNLLIPFKDEPLAQDPLVFYKDMYKEKWFRSSDNIEFYYDYNHAGAYCKFTLKDGENRYDASKGFFFQNVLGQTEETLKKIKTEIEESKSFIDAPTITPGKYKVILNSEVTGVFTHESFGHKSEADFMLGDESMKKEWTLGKKVGSDILNIVDEGSWADTSGYVPIDDEGNKKEKTYLIKQGKLAGRLHSTTTAILLDEAPTGNARAMNFQYEPIVRMTNTYIEKGNSSFEEMIKSVEKGVYIVGVKHGMGMSTFTIAPKKAYMIEKGKITSPVKVSVVSGNVFETLNLIDAIGTDFDIESSAIGGCGKMEQSPLPVADGGPSILVREMTVS